VFSGFRFARAMAEASKPVAAINIGRTRADALMTLKIEAPCGTVLEQALRTLRSRALPRPIDAPDAPVA
jgi:hypothetical protein